MYSNKKKSTLVSASLAVSSNLTRKKRCPIASFRQEQHGSGAGTVKFQKTWLLGCSADAFNLLHLRSLYVMHVSSLYYSLRRVNRSTFKVRKNCFNLFDFVLLRTEESTIFFCLDITISFRNLCCVSGATGPKVNWPTGLRWHRLQHGRTDLWDSKKKKNKTK